MPVYEYVCSACGHRTDILHGVNETGPNFCPECGTEGSMRKAFAPPTIVFKGSGWAKKERRASSSGSKPSKPSSSGEASDASASSSASSSGSEKSSGSASSD